MKPLEDLSGLEVQAGDFVWEMQSKEFVYHIGMLVMEGRTPQLSDKGRVEGPHCLPLSGHISHVCDFSKNKDCIQAGERKRQMEHLWQQNSHMCIEVCIHTSEKDTTPLLMEQWQIEHLQGVDGAQASDSLLMQAIRSHIHFSQLSAWLSRSQGAFPAHVSYKLYQPDEEPMGNFMIKPEKHTFPLASLPNNAALCVTVLSLPRHGIQDLPEEIEKLKECHLTEKKLCSPDITVNGYERRSQHIFDDRSPLKKRPCGNHDVSHNKPAVKLVNKLPLSLQQNDSKTSNARDKLSVMTHKLPTAASNVPLGAHEHKLAAVKADYHRCRSLSDGHQLSRGKCPSHMEKEKSFHQPSQEKETMAGNLQEKQTSPNVPRLPKHPLTSLGGTPFKAAHWRLIRTEACTIPVFHPETGLPVSSSPAPLRRSTTELDCEDHDLMNGLSRRPDHYAMLSKSAPASTKQSLLGNFEESVLNGRMEPLGTVQGFTGELGASGSFCPSHVTLPVTAYFFRLSDDDAPSPYLGYINLDQPVICKKGYHIPKKGTVQLTVFNPSKTVVKMFVVLYNFTDMPPRSQTFLRQKMFSAPVNSPNEESQACLHYLIHLRFASSKSGRIYLHTDIRVLFAQQQPDLTSRFRVWTVTNGPTDPKYTPRTDGHTHRHSKDASLGDCQMDLRNSTIDGCRQTQFTPKMDRHSNRHRRDALTENCEIRKSADGCRYTQVIPRLEGLGDSKDASRIEYQRGLSDSAWVNGHTPKGNSGRGDKCDDNSTERHTC